MLKIKSFTGKNNVLPEERQMPDAKTQTSSLMAADNVDIGLSGEVMRRLGFSEESTDCHLNLFEKEGYPFLGTIDGDLTNITTDTLLLASMGGDRIWYSPWPDGRVAFSNGLICGITDGTLAGTTKWGVPLPASVGAVTPTTGGGLTAGTYKYQITHVRTVDGLEGGPSYAAPFAVAEGENAVTWTGLPTLAGHRTNVYLTTQDGDVAYLAATTTGSTATFTGDHTDLMLKCETEQCYPAPAGILLGFWRGRSLLASGSLLLASRPQQWELFDLAVDFKDMGSDLTLVNPVDGGIFVGTESELAFLSGTEFDKLAYSKRIEAGVVLGSGITAPGEYVKRGDGVAGPGDCLMAICGGNLTAGYQDGGCARLTQNTYSTDATEVVAAFRLRDGIPQYVAIEQ